MHLPAGDSILSAHNLMHLQLQRPLGYRFTLTRVGLPQSANPERTLTARCSIEAAAQAWSIGVHRCQVLPVSASACTRGNLSADSLVHRRLQPALRTMQQSGLGIHGSLRLGL